MNVWGHTQAIKALGKHKEFWEKIAKQAFQQKLSTEERVCQAFARGEEKKIAWHRKEIRSLSQKHSAFEKSSETSEVSKIKGKEETPPNDQKADNKQGVSNIGVNK